MVNDDFTKLLLNKVEKIDSRLDGMSETLIRNTLSLEEHIRRTDLLEEIQVRDREAVAKRLRPIEKFVTKAKVAGALIAGAAAAIGIVLEIMSKLKLI